MLQVEDGPGALQETLKFFWKHDVNMTRIESRPAKGHNMNYSFYIDFEGKRGQPEVDELMKDLSRNCLDVVVLHDKKGERRGSPDLLFRLLRLKLMVLSGQFRGFLVRYWNLTARWPTSWMLARI